MSDVAYALFTGIMIGGFFGFAIGMFVVEKSRDKLEERKNQRERDCDISKLLYKVEKLEERINR